VNKTLAIKGIVLDMDGVITDTRKWHYLAWKEVFDFELNRAGLPEFTEYDYQKYVDGKPREEGIMSFFLSRGIEPDNDKIYSIGESKNKAYLETLKNNPPAVFKDFFEAIRKWADQKVTVLAISSSKNAKMILKRAGVDQVFKKIVDGKDAFTLRLKGKPEPDYFLEAVHEAGLLPEDCAIVEDSISGVQAGRKGNFKFVFGMSREGQTSPEELYQNGADSVISELTEVGEARNVIQYWDDFKAHIGKREIALFIDFDGTLSNIVNDPKDASMSAETKHILERCSKSFIVSIISGRDRPDVKNRVGIDSIFYSGCHGFDISGPGCFHFEVEEASRLLSKLEEATLQMTIEFSHLKGFIIEKKLYSTALHFRMVNALDEKEILGRMVALKDKFPELRLKRGKKVIELAPDVDWDKAKAVNKIIEILNINSQTTVPIYVGDDLTDEDVFRDFKRKGIGIKVGGSSDKTDAHYNLSNPEEVDKFLELLLKEYAGKEKRWKPGL